MRLGILSLTLLTGCTGCGGGGSGGGGGSSGDTTFPSNPSISINSGAASTTSTSVTLTLSATDNVGITGYCAKESSSTPSSTDTCWTSVTSTTSYSASVPFTLSSEAGAKTVYVWFRDAAGNVSSSAQSGIGTSAPSALTFVSASAGNKQVTISWSGGLSTVTYSNNIYWSTTSGVTKTTGTKITGATSPYIHTGLTNGTTYYYVVTGVDSYGESSESLQVSAKPLPVYQFVTKWGSSGTGDGQFDSPSGIAVDSSGNVYVADTSNSRIQKFSPQ